jgi:hypothetical protein
MKFWLLIVGLGVCLVTGCGRKFTPVSTITKTETKKDSTNVTTKTTSTDSSYVEKLIRKILHGTTAGISTSTSHLDSLVSVLRAMPKGADTVYLTDPKRDVALRAYYDKLTGKLVLQCQSRDREYFEKETHYRKTIEALTNQLITKNLETKTDTKTEIQKQKTFWQGIEETLKYVLWLVIAVVVIALIGAIDRFFKWLKSKFPENN